MRGGPLPNTALWLLRRQCGGVWGAAPPGSKVSYCHWHQIPQMCVFFFTKTKHTCTAFFRGNVRLWHYFIYMLKKLVCVLWEWEIWLLFQCPWLMKSHWCVNLPHCVWFSFPRFFVFCPPAMSACFKRSPLFWICAWNLVIGGEYSQFGRVSAGQHTLAHLFMYWDEQQEVCVFCVLEKSSTDVSGRSRGCLKGFDKCDYLDQQISSW